MSNTERQRRFRERHPGYYQRMHAKQRAATKATVAAMQAAREAEAGAKREPLMLPAPVVTIEIPGINSIPQKMAAEMLAVVEK
jgi:hypothetical protein